jgi:hypothetical protein
MAGVYKTSGSFPCFCCNGLRLSRCWSSAVAAGQRSWQKGQQHLGDAIQGPVSGAEPKGQGVHPGLLPGDELLRMHASPQPIDYHSTVRGCMFRGPGESSFMVRAV